MKPLPKITSIWDPNRRSTRPSPETLVTRHFKLNLLGPSPATKLKGGNGPAVIVDQGYLKDDMIQVELLRWFYTAFTRSQEKLYLLNFSDSFFPDITE